METKNSIKAMSAAQSYLDRKNGKEQAAGRVKYGWKWYPLQSEKCRLCGSISTPSLSWRHSLWDHCKSIEHIAAKHGVSKRVAQKAVKALQALNLEAAGAHK